MPQGEAQREVYSSWVGLIYVFNLIVGTGALTLPSVFSKAGWLLSSILIIGLAFISYITVTFIIEAMACANATIQLRKLQSHKIDGESEATVDTASSDEEATNEETAIISNRNRRKYFSLNQKVELGEMATLYFSKTGRILFYISLCVYLYGDLAIYTTAIAKTMSDLMCPNNHTNNTNETSSTSSKNDDDFTIECFNNKVAKITVYRLSVVLFALLICPFAYFNVEKTKYLQLVTTTMRWCAFSIMITLAAVRIAQHGNIGHPVVFHCSGVPILIGACVYSFMCHHSLPALVAPFNDKQYVLRQLALDYTLICVFYLLLALTGVFAFNDLNDLYTLNFVPTNDDHVSLAFKFILYFLGMFPICTLPMSFPIMAITLQNNLKALFLDAHQMERYSFALRRLTFPTLAVVPPILVGLSTHNVGYLVEFTGSYGGACIQYIIPAMLVYQARKHCRRDIGNVRNRYASPFKSVVWVHFIICWSLVCVVFVTINFITKGV